MLMIPRLRQQEGLVAQQNPSARALQVALASRSAGSVVHGQITLTRDISVIAAERSASGRRLREIFLEENIIFYTYLGPLLRLCQVRWIPSGKERSPWQTARFQTLIRSWENLISKQ
jgi:hypothetical protein